MNTDIMIAEENEKLLTLFAMKKLFEDSAKSIDEIIENTKLNLKTIGVVDCDNALEFNNGLKIAYTKPKELMEKDYNDKIEKLKLETLEWEKKKQEFLEDGCVDKKSEPKLSIITTTKAFKENIAKKQQELLNRHPLFAEIKNTVKQIEN